VGHCGSSNDWEGQEVLGPVEVDALDGKPARDGTDWREERALEHALARVAWQEEAGEAAGLHYVNMRKHGPRQDSRTRQFMRQ
jgi:hypothetical protein